MLALAMYISCFLCRFHLRVVPSANPISSGIWAIVILTRAFTIISYVSMCTSSDICHPSSAANFDRCERQDQNIGVFLSGRTCGVPLGVPVVP